MKKSISTFYLLLLVSLFSFLVGCACQQNVDNKIEEVKRSEAIVGADIDAHGCKASAGYIWSEVRGDCIRLFEQGIAMKEVSNTDTTLASYIIFSANDSLKAEVFFSNGTNSGVLDRRGHLGRRVWNVEDDDTYNIRKSDGRWIIEKRGVVLYKE